MTEQQEAMKDPKKMKEMEEAMQKKLEEGNKLLDENKDKFEAKKEDGAADEDDNNKKEATVEDKKKKEDEKEVVEDKKEEEAAQTEEDDMPDIPKLSLGLN